MPTPSIFQHHRMILCHFDSYSTALRFARFGDSVMIPTPLPEQVSLTTASADTDDHPPAAVLDAVLTRLGIPPARVELDHRFNASLSSDRGRIHIHLARFMDFDAPHASIEAHGGVFKPLSELRRLPLMELNLLRDIFNLIMGNG